jgi:hypothetical protein
MIRGLNPGRAKNVQTSLLFGALPKFWKLKVLGREADHTSLHIVPSMRVDGAIPLLPLHASMTWIGIALRFTFQNKNFPPELQFLLDSI